MHLRIFFGSRHDGYILSQYGMWHVYIKLLTVCARACTFILRALHTDGSTSPHNNRAYRTHCRLPFTHFNRTPSLHDRSLHRPPPPSVPHVEWWRPLVLQPLLLPGVGENGTRALSNQHAAHSLTQHAPCLHCFHCARARHTNSPHIDIHIHIYTCTHKNPGPTRSTSTD